MTVTAFDRYLAEDGPRELVILEGAAGSRLLVDRREADRGDARLLAHLAGDEPDGNAWLVCREFLADSQRGARRLCAADFDACGEGESDAPEREIPQPHVLTDALGRRYFLRATGSPPELRWQRESRGRRGGLMTLSARDVVGALETYEPVCAITRAAVARYRRDRALSVAALAVELRRIEVSPIVLNRRLREAVLEAVREHGRSLSAIAMSCGRIKHDRRGNGSGETSWLGRRVGLLPASPGGRPNPWVHSDTLALIAREGLGIAPREVELS
jgi:hypothetical protein